MATLSSKGADTKLRIIRTAADLFHRQGLHATSPDEIIEASETGKGQFYYYFKSKEGLVHEVLMWHLNSIREGKSPINYDIDSWQDLETWFYSHIELQKSFGMTRGCPFGTAANEVNESEELARQDLDSIFEWIKGRLVSFFNREKAERRLVHDANAESLADFCIATIQGAMLLGKVRRSSECAEAIVGQALAHIRSHFVLEF
jgi:TetR/AcrR family transcriptional repressor of nem operon